MWRLNRIIAKNLCAFKELDYTLKQGVTTLVFGENADNESQRSNGSGKSALLESIAIGITGSPLRKIRSEEIINDSADECYVMLEFTNTSSSEVFTIERNLYRKGASVVKCSDGVQHSVDAYNKHILEKIGITREELFNNFLLSKHKYEEFLSVSDKQKKEIINRFSNGIVVDEAIAKIEVDIEPINNELHSVELEFAGIEGRIEMLIEQIETEESSKEQKAQNKRERIATITQKIADKRSEIRGKEQYIASLSEAKSKIKACDKRVQELENSENPIEELFEQVKFELSTYGTLTDWMEVIAKTKREIETLNGELSALETKITTAKGINGEEQKSLEKLRKEFHSFAQELELKCDEYDSQLEALSQKLSEASSRSEQLTQRQEVLSGAHSRLKNMLAGTILCPKCEHQFILADSGFDVQTEEQNLLKLESDISTLDEQIAENKGDISTIESEEKAIEKERKEHLSEEDKWMERLRSAKRKAQNYADTLSELEGQQTTLTAKIASLKSNSDNIRRKIFDEAFELVDRLYATNDRDVKRCREDIAALDSSIETLQNTKSEIENSSPDDVIAKLKASLKEYRSKSTEVLRKVDETKERLSRLTEQQQRFSDFKSFIANTKIEALSKITNEFLESIGSDIRINFSGYTKLKTGKIREKISVSIIRDGLDLGSFGKLSAGEAARVNLSTILAMQKLVNSNCEDDKGLDLLVLDEILAAVDEEGNAMMFESLNSLGITSLVVSHGYVSESYPHTLTIRKENGESKVL